MLLAQNRAHAGAAGADGVFALAFGCINVGAGAMAFFAWWVFRRESPAGRVALAALALGLAGGFLGQLVGGGFALEARRGDPWYWIGFVCRMGVYAWMALESFLYHARMRRRLRHGLADALVTNRFLLWGLASACVVASGSLAALELAAGAGARAPTVPARMALFATTALAVWLTFFPPRFYRRWLEAPAPAR
jgi:hypothetical protein